LRTDDVELQYVCEHCGNRWPYRAESKAAAILGRKGRGASKRRDVDYAELGRLGGKAGKGKKKPRRKPGK